MVTSIRSRIVLYIHVALPIAHMHGRRATKYLQVHTSRVICNYTNYSGSNNSPTNPPYTTKSPSTLSLSIAITSVATSKGQDQMQRGSSLNLVLSNGLLILELLTGENESLLGRRNTLELLDLLLENGDLS